MNRCQKRLLIVEDDGDIRHLLEDLFIQEDYQVSVARDGFEALKEMKRRTYDAVLSDYHMPHMDGLAFLKTSTSLWPDIPVILASCDPTVIDDSKSRPLDRAFARLGKPFDLFQLLDTVHRAVDRVHPHMSETV